MDNKVNPLLVAELKNNSHKFTRLDNRKINFSITAHENTISNLTINNRHSWMCSTSDDKTWKIWTLQKLELLCTSPVNESWIAAANFHPTESVLASCGGDHSIKIWRLTSNQSKLNTNHVGTLTKHTQPVWSIDWHWGGTHLVSSSSDRTIRLWDVECTDVCQSTNQNSCVKLFGHQIFRGHSKSVNSVQFVPHGNVLVSASADRTVGLWDARTGLNEHMLIGHKGSVNCATFNQQGTMIISCDSQGYVRFWDLRSLSNTTESNDKGLVHTVYLHKKTKKPQHKLGANQVSVDFMGEFAVIACEDGKINCVEILSGQILSLHGHEDAVQSVKFDYESGCLYSAGADCKICSWI